MTTATLTKRYQVKVVAEYYTTVDIEAENESQAIDEGTLAFYDEAHRAEIQSAEVYDEWLYCEDCGDEHVEADHKCEEGAE